MTNSTTCSCTHLFSDISDRNVRSPTSLLEDQPCPSRRLYQLQAFLLRAAVNLFSPTIIPSTSAPPAIVPPPVIAAPAQDALIRDAGEGFLSFFYPSGFYSFLFITSFTTSTIIALNCLACQAIMYWFEGWLRRREDSESIQNIFRYPWKFNRKRCADGNLQS